MPLITGYNGLIKAEGTKLMRNKNSKISIRNISHNADFLAFSAHKCYGPKGVALIVNCLTDNKNRTVSEVRNVLSKNGGSLGTKGSVAHMFKRMGILRISNLTEDALFEHIDKVDLIDYESESDSCIIFTDPKQLFEVKKYFEDREMMTHDEEIVMEAISFIDVDQDEQEKAMNLLNKLEELDDVQSVYMNISNV
mgnify:CR=1 FL=1